jgi:DNA-directed RNA polymerase specialized sigma24 family protein
VDDDGFREFVQVRYVDLLRTAYLLSGSRDGAQDLVQNALVKAMSRWSRIDDPMAYLRRTMVNDRTARWRRIGSREFLTTVVPERWRPEADTAAILGCSVGTVKSQAARGLAKLRILLAPPAAARPVEEVIRGGKA